MELDPKVSRKAAIFLVLVLLTSCFIMFPWGQNRSNITIGHHVVSVIDGLRRKVGFPITRMILTDKAAAVSINGMDEWNPDKDILDETEIMKDGPLTDIRKTINRSLSQVYLIGNSAQYTIGDEVRIGVKLVDWYNTVRTRGGDQLRVRIFEDQKNASASGYLIDHKNGTYTAVVRALWSGSPKIVVYSAYPRELVRSWYYTFRQIYSTRLYYAHYRHKSTTAIGFCHPILDIVSNGTEFYCNRTTHNGGMSLYCSKPKSVSCKHFVRYSRTVKKRPKTRTHAEELLLRRNMESLIPFVQIKVTGTSTIFEDNLPKCVEYSKKALWMKNSPVGFFYENTWRPLHCKSLSSVAIDKCIRGMHFTLIGDSTTRQWFEYFESDYGCAVIKSNSRQSYKSCASSRHNFTADWGFHSMPGNTYFAEPTRSISGIMAKYTYTKSHIFLFHMQVHVSAYHPNVFRNRMTHIRNTIQKILDTNQSARFFVKGPHTFQDQGQFGDYFGYVYRVIMLDIFQGLHDKITYLDSKDMTIATLQTDFHPTKVVVKAMVHQFLSYVCD